MNREHHSLRVSVSRRAQSQVLGFMLVVAIALSATFFVSYMGINQLSQPTADQPQAIGTAQTETHAVALEDLSTGAPYRSTEFSGAGANIRYGDAVTITVTGSSPSKTLSAISIQAEPLIYDVGETQLVSVAGAVLLQDNNGGRVLKKAPPFEIAPQQSTLRLIATEQNDGIDQTQLGENRPAVVSSHRWSSSSTRFEPTDANGDLEKATITVTIESPRWEAWQSYFRDHSQVESVSTFPGSNEVSAEFETSRLLVQETKVHLRLDR